MRHRGKGFERVLGSSRGFGRLGIGELVSSLMLFWFDSD